MKLTANVLSFLLISALILTGCTSSSTNRNLRDTNISISGGPIPEDVWVKANEDRPTIPPRRELSRFWLLPLYAHSSHITLYPEGIPAPPGDSDIPSLENTAEGATFIWNDLLTPLIFTTLPLRIYYQQVEYERGTEEPIGKRGVAYTPFWAWSWNKGEFNDDVELKAMGVPLLFSQLKIGQERRDGNQGANIRINQFLWTLGPSLLRLNAATEDEGTIKGFYANPLFLGGGLGALVWSSYHLDAHGRDDQVATVRGHGPLLGIIGYFRTHERRFRPNLEEERLDLHDDSTTLLLGGTLWYSSKNRVNGELEKSTNGPLWGIVSVGKRNNRPAIKVLWIPIQF